MAATLDTTPPARAFSKNPIWVVVETDDPITPAATVVFTISGSGPTATETVTITFAGNSLTFTVANSDSESAFDLPVKGSDTLSDYADKFAERLAQNEVLHGYFAISRGTSGGDQTVTLTQRILAIVDIVVTESLSNVTVVPTDVAEITQGEGLRALLQVWQDTGLLATDSRLISLHAPYDLATAQVTFDISPAFAALEPALPAANTIPGVIAPSSLVTGEASGSYMPYYLRYADKAGIPAVSQALLRTEDTFIALLGSLSRDSLHPVAPDAEESPLLHNYRRRVSTDDFFTGIASNDLRKPVVCEQPDWVYALLTNEEITGVYIECHLYWSDGAESDYQPFGTTPEAIDLNKPWWFPSGYRQMKLQIASPPDDPDAYIVAYDWNLKTADLPGDGRIDGVEYRVHDLSGWNYYLLFANGAGGCESVALRGKAVEKYRSTAETFRRVLTPYDTPADHETQKYAAEATREWELNTGWSDDQDWMEHLRQLSLADGAWLIDMTNRRFLAVVVQTGDLETRQDDDLLYQLPFTVRAAWSDQDANV